MKYLLLIGLTLITLQAQVVLEMSGYGATKQKAKEEALRALSESVVSKINSSYHKKEHVSNKNYTVTQDVDLKINSDIIFKGVTYESVPSGSKEVEVRAILSDKALDETIEYILSMVEGDNTQLSKDKLKEQRIYIGHLFALLELTKGYQGSYPYATFKKQLNTLKDQNNKALNYGRLIIISDGEITVDGNKIKSGKMYYYAPGTFHYSVVKKGCVKESGSLHLYSAKETKKMVSLVCKSGKVKSFSLKVDRAYVEMLSSAVEKYGYSVNNKSTNSIEVSLKELKSFEVEGEHFYTYKVYLKITTQEKVVIKKASLKNVTSRALSTKMSRLIPLLVKAALKEF